MTLDELFMTKTLVTIREVAELLRVTPHTVYRLVASKELPAVRVGGMIRFHPEALLKYLKGEQ